jgi:hypothetical protein
MDHNTVNAEHPETVSGNHFRTPVVGVLGQITSNVLLDLQKPKDIKTNKSLDNCPRINNVKVF